MAKQIHIHLHSKAKDATPTDAQVNAYIALRKETDKLAAELEKREDQGLSVTPAMRNQLEQARKKENAVSTEIKQAARASGKFKDATEQINLSKVLAKFPGLKAYGLFDVTLMNGYVHTGSTYDIPREEMAALTAFVKSIATVKDADVKYVSKVDIRMPLDPVLRKASGAILGAGTVFYKNSDGTYTPYFARNSSISLRLPDSNFKIEK